MAATQATDRSELFGHRCRYFSLRALIVFHVVAFFTAGSIAGWIVDFFPGADDYAWLAMQSLVIGQKCLLGVWLGLGTSKWRWVLAGALVAYFGLNPILASATRLLWMGPDFMLLPFYVAAVLLVIRPGKARLMFYGIVVPIENTKGREFSIRRPIFFAIAIAASFGIGQAVIALALRSTDVLNLAFNPYFQLYGRLEMDVLWILYLMLPTVATVWAILGVGRPAKRALAVLLFALLAGLLFTYLTTFLVGAFYRSRDLPVAATLTTTFLTTAVVVASLLVVRFNGYRLVPRSPRATPNPSESDKSSTTMTATKFRPKRYWWQFSLRTLMLVLTMFCIWLGITVTRIKNYERAIASIESLGGMVSYSHESVGSRRSLVEPPGPAWLRALLGDEYFSRILFVSLLGDKFGDEELQLLQGISNVDLVLLRGTEVTDEGIKELQRALPWCLIDPMKQGP